MPIGATPPPSLITRSLLLVGHSHAILPRRDSPLRENRLVTARRLQLAGRCLPFRWSYRWFEGNKGLQGTGCLSTLSCGRSAGLRERKMVTKNKSSGVKGAKSRATAANRANRKTVQSATYKEPGLMKRLAAGAVVC